MAPQTSQVDPSALLTMKRKDLQSLCKKHGVKANGKTVDLIAQLQGIVAEQEAKSPRPQMQNASKMDNYAAAQSDLSGCRQDIVQPDVPKEANSIPAVTSKAKSSNQTTNHKAILECRTGDWMTDQLMQEINLKAALACKGDDKSQKSKRSCKIPRFQPLFTGAETSNGDKTRNFSTLHNKAFQKLDSIDVYLEKRKKRGERFKKSITSAQAAVLKSQYALQRMTLSHNTPNAKIASPKVVNIKSFQQAKIDSPSNAPSSVTRPRVKFNATTAAAHANKTPKSFDLKESLKRRLSYKPYTGKLQKANSISKNKENEPNKDVKVSVVSQKNVTCMRGRQRREKALSRANARNNNMNSRRGIA